MLYIHNYSPPPGINQGELWALQMLESSGLLPFLQETLKYKKILSEMEVAPPHKRFTQFSALIKL